MRPGASAALAILDRRLLLVMLVAGIFSELNGLYPTAAGIRLYLGRAVGQRTALSVTFTYMTTVVLVIAADAFLIGAAVRHVLREPPALAYVWIVVLLGRRAGGKPARCAPGRLGADGRSPTRSSRGPAVLSVIALVHARAPARAPASTCSARAASRAIQALAFALFLYAAFEWVTTTAEEAREPRVITRALFIAPVLHLGGRTLFALAMAHLVPFAPGRTTAPIRSCCSGKAALGTVGELWMLAMTVLTALNTFNGGFLVASRFIYAAAREGNLPRQFARAEPERRALAGGHARWQASQRSSRRWSSRPGNGCCSSQSGAAIEAGDLRDRRRCAC